MATAKEITISNYCDAVNNELVGMKTRLEALREGVKKAYGVGNELTLAHERHLSELSDMIEWKLKILMTACPFDWKGTDKDVESTVSVGPAGKSSEYDASGGYLGG
jgi:hypothetical protein